MTDPAIIALDNETLVREFTNRVLILSEDNHPSRAHAVLEIEREVLRRLRDSNA